MFTATDIANFLACRHLMTLEREAAAGNLKRPVFSDPSLDLLLKLGIEHEQKHLGRLREELGADVIEIPTTVSWPRAVDKTIDSMRKGAAVVYQAALQAGDWGGRADFLIRVDRPSALGFWSYEPVETKLARSTKAPALIQLCLYSELLLNIQDIDPEKMHLVLGGRSEPESFSVKRFAAYFRRVKREFQEAYSAGPATITTKRLEAERQTNAVLQPDAALQSQAVPQTTSSDESSATYPEPNEHCAVCQWSKHCDAQWRRDDHLSLVARITRNQRRALVDSGVATVAGLAALTLPVTPRIERIGEAALETIREQARLQVEGREQGRIIYELLPRGGDNLGLAALPVPSPADIFFDFEGAPYAFDEGLEYLFGIVTIPGEAAAPPVYEPIWALDRTDEKQAFERFIAMVMERWTSNPGMHIYHYAPYEPTAIKRLAVRHVTCVDDVDRLLRAGIFVDLYRIVRQSLRASVESYSIKKLEPLYGFERLTDLEDANRALKAFEAVLAFGPGPDPDAETRLRDAIESYNRDDCISTRRLRDWLEERRRELERETGQAIPRPVEESGEPGEGVAAQLERTGQLVELLTKDLPEDEPDWSEDQRARWLLAQMLEWHRRENKSTWWEYFRLCKLSDQELKEDKNSLGGLVYVGETGRTARSIVHRYRFPAQDHSIDRANQVHDPRTRSAAGSVVLIDEAGGTIDMKRAAFSPVPHPASLVPYDIVGTQVLTGSLLRIAAWVADNGIDGPGRFRAARELLLRRPPRLRQGLLEQVIAESSEPVRGAIDAVLGLQDSVLAIQGPPGSGKTYVGARMVLELVRNGRRVGITGASHKVISNILDEVCRAAYQAGVPLRAVQKIADDDNRSEREPGEVNGSERIPSKGEGNASQQRGTCSSVKRVRTNGEVVDAISDGANVIAGTAWLWAREELAGSVEVLFVDEAGQMSLANVLAVSPAAGSLVLLGDPQQLEQPQKGIHPPGADLSAMAHILDNQPTIHQGLGLFLPETWRLHPDICAYTSEVFYDGRLRPRAENGNQRINTSGFLDGTGLRFVAVDHVGNQSESPEEVECVARIVKALLENQATWTDKHRANAALRLCDILIVSPYNAQISALVHKLPGARAGTVDKFQGQQAPVVIYSMATSTPEDAPRGMDFLYSSNRLNVAISRAQCLAVLVASPALFQVQCKTPRQIALANAFCRYLELVEG